MTDGCSKSYELSPRQFEQALFYKTVNRDRVYKKYFDEKESMTKYIRTT